MKQFKTILGYELKNVLTNKAFIGVTVFLVLAISVVMFFPYIMGIIKYTDKKSQTSDSSRPVMLVVSDDIQLGDTVSKVFSSSFSDYDVKALSYDIDSVQDMIISDEAECAFVLDGVTSYTYYVNNLSMYDEKTYIADEILQNMYRTSSLINAGVSQDDVSGILGVQIKHETKSLGKDQMRNFFYTYIMIFALYMVILLYGQMVATNVAAEKSSRAMELLITSANPVSMMFGKVIASCLAGFIQLIAIFGSAFVSFNINRHYWEGNIIVSSIFDIPPQLLAYMLIFFVLGFFVYAFMYGAVGSTVSKLEDINTSVMPITFIFVFGFLAAMMSMSSGNIDNILMKICSYIPFTSPMAMFTRIAMSTVPLWQIMLSISILVMSSVAIGVISAKIYRVGVLMYGIPPKPLAILKAIRKTNKISKA